MDKRKQFTFYRSYYKALQGQSARRRLGILDAIIAYGLDGVEPQGLDSVQMMAFSLIRPTLEAGRRKAMGGMKSKRGKSSPKDADNKKENELEKEMENEIEIENETEIEEESLYTGGCGQRPGFEEFWEQYPVKVAKEQARKAWQDENPDPQAVLEGLARWRNCPQWTRENRRYVPRAAKFLKERHYADVPSEKAIWGCSGVLGQAELEAIEKILQEEEVAGSAG